MTRTSTNGSSFSPGAETRARPECRLCSGARRRLPGPPRSALVPALVLVAFLAGKPAQAQRYHTKIYTDSDGLPSSMVFDVSQDVSGRTWFATRSGVAVYYGWEWTQYDVSDGLPTVNQRRVMCDGHGRVWAVGDLCKSAVFEHGAWQALPTFAATGIRHGLPAAVVAHGDRSILLVAPAGGGVHYYTGDAWSVLPLPRNHHEPVCSMASGRDRVYLATDRGILVFDPERPEEGGRPLPGMPPLRVRGIALDPSKETLWVAGRDYIGRFRDGHYETLRDDVEFDMTVGYDFLVCEPDRFGGLYVGNPVALYRCDESGIEQFGFQSGLSGGGVTSLFEDREGNMWAGTLRGVTKFISLRFANYSREHGLLEDEVTAILERASGDFVLGHPNGFTLFSDHMRTISLPRKADSRVLDLAQDRSGNVWAAVSSHGLAKIDPRGSLEWVEPENGPGGRITSVFVDRDDRLWVSSTTTTYLMVDGRLEPRQSGVEVDELTGYLRRFFQVRDGTVYLATAEGLFALRPGSTEHLTVDSPPTANNVYSFLEDSHGVTWVGTMDGLYKMRGGGLSKVEQPGPRIDRTVYFITEDHDGRLWFGTGNGVMRWDGKALEWFTREEGLVGRETNRAAGIVDSRGRVWIGMDGGVSVYRPEFDVNVGVPPIVEIAGVDVNGQVYTLGDKLELGPGENNLIFRFRAMTFTDERNVSFRSWLEGFDEGWSEPSAGRSREIRYTNLPPGQYRFHMRAAGANGVWSPPISSSEIVIDAPLWRKPLFIASSLAAAVLALFAAVGFVVQRRYARRLEFQVRSRVAELQRAQEELERARRIETLGVLAGGIAHDFNNLLTVIKGNLSLLKDRLKSSEGGSAQVGDALAAADHARALTQQLLTFSRGGAPVREPGSISHVIRESASFTMSGASVRCDVDLPPDLWVVDIDANQMSQVINNLLLNAKEAMPAGGVIDIRGRNLPTSPLPELDAGRYVEITIEDRGEGISPEFIDRVFDPYFTTKESGNGLGLTLAYSIVKRHDGLLTLQSQPGRGTRCVIRLPASEGEVAEPVVGEEQRATGSVKGHILVMDDQKAIRSVAGKVLALFGHTVEHAGDGAAAVSLYKKRFDEGEPFDLVIMDLTVPGGMGGREAMNRLKDIDPAVKAIVASGYSNDPVMAEYASFGFCSRLSKPYSGSELVRAVNQILSASA
jgi:signal transduction histidine kinase/ActR/RegA family two-component response regulator